MHHTHTCQNTESLHFIAREHILSQENTFYSKETHDTRQNAESLQSTSNSSHTISAPERERAHTHTHTHAHTHTHMWQDVLPLPPFLEDDELGQAEWKMECFMRDVLLPLAVNQY